MGSPQDWRRRPACPDTSTGRMELQSMVIGRLRPRVRGGTNRRPLGQPTESGTVVYVAAAVDQGVRRAQTSARRTGTDPMREVVHTGPGKHGGDKGKLEPFSQSCSIRSQTRCHRNGTCLLMGVGNFDHGLGRPTSGRGPESRLSTHAGYVLVCARVVKSICVSRRNTVDIFQRDF